MDVNAHLASCEVCREQRTALLDLTALLAAEGASPLEMPADVAGSIDAALTRAGAERAAGIPTIAPQPGTASRRSGRRQPLRWLAGAAAAVVVLGVGVAGLRALPSTTSSDAGASTAPDSLQSRDSGQSAGRDGLVAGSGQVKEPAPTMPESGGAFSPGSLTSAADVAAAGRELSHAPADARRPARSGCAHPLTEGLTTVVQFRGHPAVLTVTPETRLATIYDCATATRTLLVTGY
jgi:hypothetical protein